MKISELVKGESIKLDNHHSAHDISIDDQGLHFHKRFNHRSRYTGQVDVLLPLNSGDIQVKTSDGPDSEIILREIKKAFSNKKKRDQFIKEVKEELSSLASAGRIDVDGQRILDDIGKEKVNKALVKIAEQFGLGEETVRGNLYETGTSITKEFKSPINMMTGGRNFPEVLYVTADISDVSFFVTSSKYMLQ